jgi:ribosomal protein L37AE/L43A
MTQGYVIAGRWRPWTCPTCAALNVSDDAERVWTCERCQQRWRRT